jgi:hypothetical protein
MSSNYTEEPADNYETEKVKVHYFRYLGRTAIGTFLNHDTDMLLQLGLNPFLASLLSTQPLA